MKQIVKVLVVIVGSFFISVLDAKKEKIESKTFSLSSFSKLKLHGGGEVTLSQGDENKVTISGPKDIIFQTSVEVHGSKCVIKRSGKESKTMISKVPIKYEITVKNITSLSAHGSFTFKNIFLKGDHLKINLSGSQEINAQLNFDSLKIKSSGNNELTFEEGDVKNQTIKSSGVFTYNAEKLKGLNVTLDTMGSATIKLGKVEKIEGNLSRNTDLEYQGKPKLSFEQRTSKNNKG